MDWSAFNLVLVSQCFLSLVGLHHCHWMVCIIQLRSFNHIKSFPLFQIIWNRDQLGACHVFPNTEGWVFQQSKHFRCSTQLYELQLCCMWNYSLLIARCWLVWSMSLFHGGQLENWTCIRPKVKKSYESVCTKVSDMDETPVLVRLSVLKACKVCKIGLTYLSPTH